MPRFKTFISAIAKMLGVSLIREGAIKVLVAFGYWPYLAGALSWVAGVAVAIYYETPPWVVILVVVFGLPALIFLYFSIGSYLRYKPTPENRKLILFWLHLSNEIMDAVTEDDRRDPTMENMNDDWDARMARSRDHSSSASTTYNRRFSGRVEAAKREMTDRGLLTKEDEGDLTHHMVNPIGRRRASVILEAVARQYARQCQFGSDEFP